MLEYLVLVVDESKLSVFSITGNSEKFTTDKTLVLENSSPWNFLEHKNNIFTEFNLKDSLYDHLYVVVNSKEYTSLEITLPFNSKNLVEQTLEIQVSEKIPFDIDDFCISYNNISTNEGNYVYHVGLLPKKIIEDIIILTKGSKTQADLITTIPSLLKNSQVENGILFYTYEDTNFGIVIKDSKTIEDFIFTGDPVTSHEILLRSEKYELQASEIEFKGDFSNLLSEFIFNNQTPEEYLVNFRVMKYGYNKALNNTITLVKDLSFPITFCIFGIIIYIFLNYFTYSRTISTYKSSISSILTQFPELQAENIKSTEEIASLNYKLSNELSSLNSQSKGALEYLANVTTSIESAGGSKEYNISSVTITSQKIIVEGSSKSYANVEKLERAFNRLKNTDYCNITKNTSGTEQARNFTFTLDLICQS